MKDALKRLQRASKQLDVAMEQAQSMIDGRVRPATKPARRHTMNVTRAEFNAVLETQRQREETIAGFRRDLDIQFRRIAEIQASLDRVSGQIELLLQRLAR